MVMRIQKKWMICVLAVLLLSGCGKTSENSLNSEDGEMDSTESQIQETTDNTEETMKEETKFSMEDLFDNMKLTNNLKGVTQTNPLMTQRFGADPYALVYEDRVYFYMTADSFEYDKDNNILENSYSKIHSINVISTDDMINFTDHGTINAASKTGAATWASNSWHRRQHGK